MQSQLQVRSFARSVPPETYTISPATPILNKIFVSGRIPRKLYNSNSQTLEAWKSSQPSPGGPLEADPLTHFLLHSSFHCTTERCANQTRENLRPGSAFAGLICAPFSCAMERTM